jgi:hypothetical protein
MKVRPNPRCDVFLTSLPSWKRPFVKWKGIAFRVTPLPYANAVKLLDG